MALAQACKSNDAQAELIAVPGCYPTASLSALKPLMALFPFASCVPFGRERSGVPGAVIEIGTFKGHGHARHEMGRRRVLGGHPLPEPVVDGKRAEGKAEGLQVRLVELQVTNLVATDAQQPLANPAAVRRGRFEQSGAQRGGQQLAQHLVLRHQVLDQASVVVNYNTRSKRVKHD